MQTVADLDAETDEYKEKERERESPTFHSNTDAT